MAIYLVVVCVSLDVVVIRSLKVCRSVKNLRDSTRDIHTYYLMNINRFPTVGGFPMRMYLSVIIPDHRIDPIGVRFLAVSRICAYEILSPGSPATQ